MILSILMISLYFVGDFPASPSCLPLLPAPPPVVVIIVPQLLFGPPKINKMKPVQTVTNSVFYIQSPTPTRQHAETIAPLTLLTETPSQTKSDAQKLYKSALLFSFSLRESLANWWPFRIGDGVGIVIPEQESVFEFLVVVLGTWMAGGTVVLFNAEGDMSKVVKVEGIRVLVCPSSMSSQFPFPTMQYGELKVGTGLKDLKTRTVKDLIARGEFLEPILLPIFSPKDVYQIALVHESPHRYALTHRQVVQRIQSTAIIPDASATFEARELDVRRMKESPEVLIDVVLSALYMASRGYKTSPLVFKHDVLYKSNL